MLTSAVADTQIMSQHCSCWEHDNHSSIAVAGSIILLLLPPTVQLTIYGHTIQQLGYCFQPYNSSSTAVAASIILLLLLPAVQQ